MKRILTLLCLLCLFIGPSLVFGANKVVIVPLFSNCAQSCPEGLTDCAGKCVDTGNNPEFCGDCDASCAADQYCSQGVCVRHDGLTCTDSSECMSGNCVDGVCCDTSCDSLCDSCLATSTGGTDGTCSGIIAGSDPDSECPGATFCLADGSCSPVAKDNGAACSAGTECLSGNCVDGVCCDSSCGSLCESCLAASSGGTDGTCGSIPYNTDPNTECATGQRCDGAGVCKGVPGADCDNGSFTQGSGVDSLCLSDRCTETPVAPPLFSHACSSL